MPKFGEVIGKLYVRSPETIDNISARERKLSFRLAYYWIFALQVVIDIIKRYFHRHLFKKINFDSNQNNRKSSNERTERGIHCTIKKNTNNRNDRMISISISLIRRWSNLIFSYFRRNFWSPTEKFHQIASQTLVNCDLKIAK